MRSIINGGTMPSPGNNYNAPQYNQRSQVNYHDKDGSTLLESQAISWTQQNCKVNCSTVQTATTTMNNMVKPSTYGYDQFSNLSDEWDYDWGAGQVGGLLRHLYHG